MSTLSVLASGLDESVVARGSGATQLPLVARLEIARELAASLDHATGAGQSHIMTRVVQILRGAALWPVPRATPVHRGSATAMLDALEREAGRIAPDPAAFRQRAIRLINLIVHR